MATKRKKTTAAKKRAAPAQAAPAAQQKTDPRWSIALFAAAAFVVALCLIPGESAWAWMRMNLLFGVFGICGWVLGPLVAYWAVLMSRGRRVLPAVFKGAFLLLAICGCALVFGKLDFEGLSFGEVWMALLANGKTMVGGGLWSLLFGWSLLSLCGRAAARVLLVIILLLALMVFTGLTPVDVGHFVKRLWKRRPRRQVYEAYDQYDDYDVDDGDAYEAPPVPRPVTKGRRKQVDIALDAPPVASEVGRAEQVAAQNPVGGSFGVPAKEEFGFPEDEPLLPFNPFSRDKLPINTETAQGMLLFGEDDPYAYLGGARTRLPVNRLPDVEYIEKPAPAPDFDLFGRVTPAAENAGYPTPSLPGSTEGAPPMEDGEQAVSIGTEADALIEKALAGGKKAGRLSSAAGHEDAGSQWESYQRPPLSLFAKSPAESDAGAREEMKRTADLLVNTLSSFGVQTRILDVTRGPSVTRYEVQPQAGVKISRITNLADDIALNLAAAGVRIEAPIPGKPAVGIEVPNRKKSTVSIRSILESEEFQSHPSPLSMALGKDIAGDIVVADLTKMPHLLIAGATGSGKSVCVNSIITSFLYKSSPEEVQMMLIDPKVVELAEYNGIPHLLIPVVTEPRQAARALGYAVTMMEQRYHLFAENNVRDIRSYNKKAERSAEIEKLPHIVIIIDELADLMMAAGKDVETYICRIAQKARAAGMHLIVATQRPSVDVITGLIKANIPSRIAFAVSSQVDSRTILDGAGAEKLLGMGDMLFMPVGANKPVRVQGTYVKDKEISSMLGFVKRQAGAQYDESVLEGMDKVVLSGATAAGEAGEGDSDALADPTFVNAVETALEAGQISTSFLQRRLRLGYARAGRIMDEMEAMGIVSGPDGAKPRQVLINRQQWQEMVMNAEG